MSSPTQGDRAASLGVLDLSVPGFWGCAPAGEDPEAVLTTADKGGVLARGYHLFFFFK